MLQCAHRESKSKAAAMGEQGGDNKRDVGGGKDEAPLDIADVIAVFVSVCYVCSCACLHIYTFIHTQPPGQEDPTFASLAAAL